MITVKQFLSCDFQFVVDDALALNNNQNATYNLTPADLSAIEEEQERYNDDFVINLAWRKNTGVMPVSADCWVDVEFVSGVSDTDLACTYNLGNNLLTKWKPSLKHLEQQMNDNQETKTALEMSERDVENFEYDYKPERELKESDEVIWNSGDIAIHDGNEVLVIDWHPHHPLLVVEGGNGFFATSSNKLSKPETPEQKAARERIESAYDLYVTCGIQHETISFDKFKKEPIGVWLYIVDKTGYRKQ